VSPNARPRIVIDTCVCLDLYVFADARAATLRGALERGEVEAVTNDACRDEWLRVLAYPQFAIDDERRAALVARFDAHVARRTDAPRAIALPPCADPDDQKFLELARDADACALVTKDRALLKLWRRVARLALFAIVPPEVLASQALWDPAFWTTMRGGEGRQAAREHASRLSGA